MRETPIGDTEFSESKVVDVLSVECDNGMVDFFEKKPEFRVMSLEPKKPKWIVLRLDNIASDEDIKALIDQSYAYVLQRAEKGKNRRRKVFWENKHTPKLVIAVLETETKTHRERKERR